MRIDYIWSLTRQFAKYGEWGKVAASIRLSKAERVSTRGLRPGTLSLEPAGGSASDPL